MAGPLRTTMSFGGSILPQVNGPGWAEAATAICNRVRMAYWACPIVQIALITASSVQVGLIRTVNFGCLAGWATIETDLRAVLTIFGTFNHRSMSGAGSEAVAQFPTCTVGNPAC